jgi:hypothetical protein
VGLFRVPTEVHGRGIQPEENDWDIIHDNYECRREQTQTNLASFKPIMAWDHQFMFFNSREI